MFPREMKRTNGIAGNKMKANVTDNNNTTNYHNRKNGAYAMNEKPPQDKNNIRSNMHVIERNQIEKENNFHGNSHTNRKDRRDSLDELIENPQKSIPGLENYYASNQGISRRIRAASPVEKIREEVSQNNSNRGQQLIKKSDYAELLRQQIETKKTLVDDEGFERNKRSSRNENIPQKKGQYSDQQSQLQYKGRQTVDPEPSQQPLNKRTQYGSGAGKSSISLSWD
jgi:hypothetical protein